MQAVSNTRATTVKSIVYNFTLQSIGLYMDLAGFAWHVSSVFTFSLTTAQSEIITYSTAVYKLLFPRNFLLAKLENLRFQFLEKTVQKPTLFYPRL